MKEIYEQAQQKHLQAVKVAKEKMTALKAQLAEKKDPKFNDASDQKRRDILEAITEKAKEAQNAANILRETKEAAVAA